MYIFLGLCFTFESQSSEILKYYIVVLVFIIAEKKLSF